MPLLGLRLDFRNPSFAGTSFTERYRAGLDMAEWADRHGFLLVVLSEHHGSEDGYLPSALTMAAAVAARTENVRILVSAIPAPLHDPMALAEQVAVVDQLSGGRLSLVLTNGYVPEEFAARGVPMSERAARTSRAVELLRSWPESVTPAPVQQPFPVVLGGSSPGAARRAARIADGFMPSTPEVWQAYRDECLALGKPDPGPPVGGDTSVVHVAADAHAGWAELAPYAMHETNAYAAWLEAAGLESTEAYARYDDPAALRESGRYRVLTPAALLAELREEPYRFTMLHPLVGGLPPELGWSSLRLLEEEVLPQC